MEKANLSGIHDLFNLMEREDPDWQRLLHLPGLMDLWNDAKIKLNTCTEEFTVQIKTVLSFSLGFGPGTPGDTQWGDHRLGTSPE